MRTKEEIIDTYESDIGYYQSKGSDTNATQGYIFLEVLIDIRDQFGELRDILGSIHDRLIDINTNLPFGG